MPKQKELDGAVCGFIQKLWDILQNSQFQKFLLWNSSGTSFTILNPEALEKTLLPLFFRHSKLKSFVRQLNMYGFKKNQRAKSHLVFSNPDFRRDEESKLCLIRRQLSKKSRTLAPKSQQIAKEEPSELYETHNDVSMSQAFISQNEEEDAHINTKPHAENNKEAYHQPASNFQIRSYRRLSDQGRCFVPFVSPYSYASIKSEKQEAGVPYEGSFLEIDLFKNGSTDADEAWPYAFTSCEYFV